MKIFRGLTPYLSRKSGDSDLVTIFLLFTAALSSLIPAFLHRVFFDRVIPDRGRELIVPILILLVLVESAGVFSRFQADRQLACRSRENRHRRRIRLVDRLWLLRISWFDAQGPGAVIRHYDDAGLLGDMRSVFIREIIGPALILLVLLPPMFVLQPVLAACRITATVPAMITGFVFLNRDLQYERKIWSVRKRLTTDLFRGARGVSTLKSGRGGDGYARYLRSIMDKLGLLEEQRRILGARWEAVAAAATRVGGALILVLAVFLVIEGRLTFGSYIAFSILSSRSMAAMGEFLGGIRSLARTGNAVNRHQNLFLQETDEGPPSVSLNPPSSGQGGLNIAGLTFAYPDSGKILRDLNLNVMKGERVLLSGGSGAGKSTLFSIILGFYSPLNGRISLSGMSLIGCTASRRRELIGAVLQNPSFFDGTVRDNLCLYGAAPSDRCLWAALEAAAADDIVSGIPGGLNARLTGEDSCLSGGQRQRLAIARLMVRPPSLILLDEPVNALDAACNERVRHSLAKACEGRTVLLISHDAALPLQVHRRLSLTGGYIRESEIGETDG